MKSYLVLAIGNTLLSDDGVGAKVLEYLNATTVFPSTCGSSMAAR